MRRLPAFTAAATLTAAALVLTACTEASQEPGGNGATDETGAAASFDPSTVEVDEDIAAMLPADVAEGGTLNVGSDTTYAPNEFIAPDGQTPIGFDVDMAKAIGAVLGLETEVESAAFDGIIPAVGSKYDVGISSFTINPERVAEVNMISYFIAGSQYAVAAGNPDGFDSESLCGVSIAVQTATIQDDELTALSEDCEKDGDEPIDVLRYDSQADATTNLVGGKAQAMYADSPVVGYAVEQTDGSIEAFGDIRDAAPYGIVVSQDDAELTEAVQAAVQKLMDDGTLEEAFAAWGSADGVLDEAELNPAG
jgi:polar amino acid transport system substrate-binding protein